MSATTSIAWTDVTWNPVTGCRKVSPGCEHCYAERVFPRTAHGQRVHGAGTVDGHEDSRQRRFTDVWTHPDRLDAPLHWRKPRRIFVNSMSDLFHEDVPDEFIDQVFAVMALAKQHTYQILTKRPERMRAYLMNDTKGARWSSHMVTTFRRQALARFTAGVTEKWFPKHADHIWLGVSAEDQQRADERVPILLDTPAAVRFVSAEPLLGPVDFSKHHVGSFRGSVDVMIDALRGRYCAAWHGAGTTPGEADRPVPRLDWIIVGGESGPKARLSNLAWARAVRDQCSEAGVAFFFKQAGSRVADWPGFSVADIEAHDPAFVSRIRYQDRKGGALDELPADLRIREFPSTTIHRGDLS